MSLASLRAATVKQTCHIYIQDLVADTENTIASQVRNYQNITNLTVTHNISTRTMVAKQTSIICIAQQDSEERKGKVKKHSDINTKKC
jgi:hypothetical protein